MYTLNVSEYELGVIGNLLEEYYHDLSVKLNAPTTCLKKDEDFLRKTRLMEMNAISRIQNKVNQLIGPLPE